MDENTEMLISALSARAALVGHVDTVFAQAADTIERQAKDLATSEQVRQSLDDALTRATKTLERMHRQFCGARKDTDVCRDEAGYCELIRERDEACAEVERLRSHRFDSCLGCGTVINKNDPDLCIDCREEKVKGAGI